MLGSLPFVVCVPGFRIPTRSCLPPPPPPIGGCGNPQLICDILDCCNWLMYMPGYPLKGSMEAPRVEIERTAEGDSSHHPP
jgi:hypothetical protein